MNLPPFVQPGDDITDELWNNLVRFVLRNRINLGQSSGLEANQGETGTTLRATPSSTRHLAITTSIITAASGFTYGYGTALFLNDNGTSLSAGTLAIDKLKSYHDKAIANGAIVWVDQAVDGGWWVIDVDKCSNLS